MAWFNQSFTADNEAQGAKAFNAPNRASRDRLHSRRFRGRGTEARFQDRKLQDTSQLFSRQEGDEMLWMTLTYPDVIETGTEARFQDRKLQDASQLFSRQDGDEMLWMTLTYPDVIETTHQGNGQGKETTIAVPSIMPAKDAVLNWMNSRRPRFPHRSVSIAAFMLAFPFALAVLAAVALAFSFTFSETVEKITQDLVSALLNGAEVAEDVSEALACASRASVVDATRQSVGWIPVTGGCALPGDRVEDGQKPSPHLMTSTVQDRQTIEFLAPATAALEGNHNGPGTLYALNAWGLIRAFLREAKRLRRPDLARIGGSTAVLSGFETLRDMHGRPLTAKQKIVNMRDMVAFVSTSLPQGIERDQFAATTNPVLLIHDGPAGGMSVSGEMAMEVLFGRPRIETEWEACLFVAAFYTQIVIPAPSDRPDTARASRELFLTRLTTVKKRADECLSRLVEKGKLTNDNAETARLSLSGFLPHMSVWDQGTATHLPGAFAALRDERLLLGPDAGSMETYLVPNAQRMLARTVEDIRDRTANSIGEKLCYTACDDAQHAVDILTVAVAVDGDSAQVVAINQSRSGLFHGPVVSGEDGYIRGKVTRSLGSLPKLYLALRLAAEGVTHLCPRAALGLSDANGGPAADCSDRTQWLTLEESIAQSSNRALAEGVRILGVPMVLKGMQELGARIVDADDRRRIVTGVGVPNCPERFIRFLTALGRGTDGRPASGYLPQISVGPRQGFMKLPAELFTAQPALLRAVLAAPVAHPQGTLRSLRDPLSQRGCDLTSLIAKTGSSETADETGTGIRDRYIALYLSCPDSSGAMQNIAVFTMIGSPRIDIPLTGVTTGNVRALALAALDAGLQAAAINTQNPVIKENE